MADRPYGTITVRPLPRRPVFLLTALAAASWHGLAGTALAIDEFRLQPTSLPAHLLDDSVKPNVVIEASGVVPIGDGRRFLVAHDKASDLHVVEAATGRLVGGPITAPGFPEAGTVGPKWEGMALDSEANCYVIVAHNGKTDEEKGLKNVLLRFRLKDGPEPAAGSEWSRPRRTPTMRSTAISCGSSPTARRTARRRLPRSRSR
jgi:hypothetical protein